MGVLLTDNQIPVTSTTESQIALGGAVHGSGCDIKLRGNGISINKKGYYSFLAVVDTNITGTDAATVSLMEDGTVVTKQTITPSGAGGSAVFVIPWLFRVPCGCNAKNVTLKIDVGATIRSVTTKTEEII